MTSAEIVLTCQGIASTMLDALERQDTTIITPTLLAHALRDLANICEAQQRQLNRLTQSVGS
jgi:hypothetical protein